MCWEVFFFYTHPLFMPTTFCLFFCEIEVLNSRFPSGSPALMQFLERKLSLSSRHQYCVQMNSFFFLWDKKIPWIPFSVLEKHPMLHQINHSICFHANKVTITSLRALVSLNNYFFVFVFFSLSTLLAVLSGLHINWAMRELLGV